MTDTTTEAKASDLNQMYFYSQQLLDRTRELHEYLKVALADGKGLDPSEVSHVCGHIFEQLCDTLNQEGAALHTYRTAHFSKMSESDHRFARDLTLSNGVESLKDVELRYALSVHDLYHTPQEGYGVIYGESREVADEYQDVLKSVVNLDNAVYRHDSVSDCVFIADHITTAAQRLAVEAIHVAAAAAKFRESAKQNTRYWEEPTDPDEEENC